MKILEQGQQLVLESSAFAFSLDTADGLCAVSWANRLTGRTIGLGGGPEVELDIGLPGQPLQTPKLRVVKASIVSEGPESEALVELAGDDPSVSVKVAYRWDETQPVIRKFVTVINRSASEWDRLLNVRLGGYRTDAGLAGGEFEVYPPSLREAVQQKVGLQGFPVYADGEFFFGLAHPAGWAKQKPGEISLRHYPGTKLPAGASYACMEAVYGVSAAGRAREAFVAHVRTRMRRVRRGHDRPYAIYEPFGARPDGDFDETEAFVLEMIERVAEGQRDSNCRFDFFSVDFWVDHRGDLKRTDPVRFPKGFERIKAALSRAGIQLGLWIDSAFCGWSIGGNPATHRAIAQPVGPDFGELDGEAQQRFWFCRATEPIRSLYREAFCHHLRENGVRLLKFDDFASQCSNAEHDHLPGVYANEAIHEAGIEFFRALDAECPDVFLMLYWGYRSPWWLLFADTLFETGVQMEAASPGHLPAPFIRDGITRKLDQGHVHVRDLPWLGTDTLGVWLSHWGHWNSGVGTERWPEGMVMDICRGHALLQPWSDPQWLTPADRRQMGEFTALMNARPRCFTNARLILGDPWKVEPYGYCCSDGQRAFLAINNATWEDRALTLQLNAAWGLPPGRAWDLFRWYPAPARLTGETEALGPEVVFALRPFEVVLLEAVPHGEPPALPRHFVPQPLPVSFAEASRPVPVSVSSASPSAVPVRTSIRGYVMLPAECRVFAPFRPEDGVPSPESLRQVPRVLELGGRHVAGKPASFDANRILDLVPFLEETVTVTVRKTAFVFIPFTAPDAGPVTFGFGADWWYEAYLDGTVMSETLSRKSGNQKWPPGIGDQTVTVELKKGEHLLVLRVLRGAGSALVAAGGPLDLRNVAWRHIRGQIPACPDGGLLVIVAELTKDDRPWEISHLGSYLSAAAMVAGTPVPLCPALGPRSHPSSWQSWRYEIAPGAAKRAFEVWVGVCPQIEEGQLHFTAHFLPR